jgi:hypothetical protein
MKRRKQPPLELNDLYDLDKDRIMIPAGLKVFVATGYKGRYPILYVKVAGVTKYKRNIRDLSEADKEFPGVGMKAILVPEPSNPYDPCAIKIMAGLKISAGCEYHIGYVPASLAKLLTQIKNEYNMSYTARVESLRSNFYKGEEMSWPPSARVKLTPNTKTKKKVANAPRTRTVDVGTGGMSVKQLQEFLSKKRV